MNSHIVTEREPVSQHLAIESRSFPANSPTMHGLVKCNQCPMTFCYAAGPPVGWEYGEAAGIGSYNCPAHLITRRSDGS